MLGQKDNLNKNLKDTEKDTSLGSSSLIPWHSNFSYYNKTNKLITALYMVTDTMDKEEPIRLKLRTLGVEILSDTSAMPKVPFDIKKIEEVLSFLSIAFDIGMISEMNSNILKKEFMALKQSIQEFQTQNHLWLEEFIAHPSEEEFFESEINSSIGHLHSAKKNTSLSFIKGQNKRTRIGVQKGNTLLKALNNFEGRNDFEAVKNQRRELILKVIRACPPSGVDKPGGISIKDIIFGIKTKGQDIGGKTLQRELVSMVHDGVLKKTGEKRWSIYTLGSPPAKAML